MIPVREVDTWSSAEAGDSDFETPDRALFGASTIRLNGVHHSCWGRRGVPICDSYLDRDTGSQDRWGVSEIDVSGDFAATLQGPPSSVPMSGAPSAVSSPSPTDSRSTQGSALIGIFRQRSR